MLTETQPQQLLVEARNWITQLVTYVEGINGLKTQFYKWAAGKTHRDELIQIEHFHNQFHIQLINLHDLKHAIRQHIKEVEFATDTDHTEKHVQLEDQYNFLIKDLDNLKKEFTTFVGA
jgi:hypothetical protein